MDLGCERPLPLPESESIFSKQPKEGMKSGLLAIAPEGRPSGLLTISGYQPSSGSILQESFGLKGEFRGIDSSWPPPERQKSGRLYGSVARTLLMTSRRFFPIHFFQEIFEPIFLILPA